MGTRGRYLAIESAVPPVSVSTTSRGQFASILALTADEHTDSTGDMTLTLFNVVMRMDRYRDSYSMTLSASSQMRRMMVTAFSGKSPPAVSPESITASVPSRTALATSLASARVGLGKVIMDSNICVAVTTGFPILLQTPII